MKLFKQHFIIRGSALLLLGLSACFNNLGESPPAGNSTVGLNASPTPGDSYVIANINVSQPAGSPSPTPSSTAGSTEQSNIFFDTSQSTATIDAHCNTVTPGAAAQTGKPCNCLYTWGQLNTTSGQSVQIPRSVQTGIITVQPDAVTCPVPSVYDAEIPDGTVIKISVIAASGNADAFTVKPYNYTKNSSAIPGSFQDAQGQSFQNILRYSCYQAFQKGLNIQSKIFTAVDPTTGTQANAPIGSQFCVQTAAGNGANSAGCTTLPPPDYTAQSFYYNFFIRSSEVGDINLSNANYSCPQVQESLAGSSTVGAQGQAWPLDSTFALSLAPTVNYPVAVEAFTELAQAGNPNAVNSPCFPSSSPSGTPTSSPGTLSTDFVLGCLGFAATPSAGGTCPYFRDSNGQIRNTYRLRRYIVLYPPLFDANGASLGSQRTDTLYVLDRPLATGSSDPTIPYTMKGPKPCPFSYFDNRGVTGTNATGAVTTGSKVVTNVNPSFGISIGMVVLDSSGFVPAATTVSSVVGTTVTLTNAVTGTNAADNLVFSLGGTNPNYTATNGIVPTYAATDSSAWTGKNVDGTQFPNQDTATSCSASMPVFSSDNSVMSVATINAANTGAAQVVNGIPFNFKSMYIRPVRAWSPHYEEDTAFQACAPLAQPLKDPPLHFARDNNGNVSWCAEAYPSQNNDIQQIDKLQLNGTLAATGHVTTGSTSITTVNPTTGITIGNTVSDTSGFIPAGALVTAIAGTTVTINLAATGTNAADNLTFNTISGTYIVK